MTQSRVCPQ